MLFVAVLLGAIAVPIGLRVYTYWYPAPFFSGPTATLCVMDGSDLITQRHVENLLSNNGINSMTEGSKLYGTVIEESKLELATKLLEESANDKLSSIKTTLQKFDLLWVSTDDRPMDKHEISKSIDDFDPVNKDLITNLVLAIRDHASSTYLAQDKLPIVKSISVRQRDYVNRQGSHDPAYQVKIHLVNKPENPTAEFTESYQIMDDFKTVIGSGGHGTGDLPD